MSDKLPHIIEKSAEVFLRYGIRSVNMDDVAKHLRMSKKTLYQYVNDKNDLVKRVVFGMCQEHDLCIQEIGAEGLNAIDESFKITEFVAGILKGVHPSVHFDLEKYHPEVWHQLKEFERESITKCMTSNIEKGIEEGLYREDINIPIIVKIYIARFDVVFDGEIFPPSEYDFADVQWEVFRYHIRGIASEKGIRYLKKKVKSEKQ